MRELPDFPISFSHEREKHQWVIDNAQYWTAVRFKNRSYLREEFQTKDEALQWATDTVTKCPDTRGIMIYAVAGGHDTLFKVIFNTNK